MASAQELLDAMASGAVTSAAMGMGQLTHTTAMCWAAAKGDVDMMKQLLQYGADVNAADYDKRTPLHIAVSDNQVEAVRFLLDQGATVTAVDRWGRSPIDCAIDARNAQILSLLERVEFASQRSPQLTINTQLEPTERRSPGVEQVAEAKGLEVPRRDRATSSADVLELFQAIKAGDAERVKRAWLDGIELNATDAAGRTSVHVAVEHAQVRVLELLLSADVNTHVIDREGRSPMSIAIEKQLYAISDMLRNHQRSKVAMAPMVLKESDPPQVARAFEATKRGDLAALQLLVPGTVHPDVQDYDLRSLLHIASAEGQLDIARYLVQCGANVNLLDRWGTSPLSEAVDFAQNELAQFLIANHASESGNRTTISIDQIDNATLNTALEFTLRVVTRKRWLMGQVYCPVQDESGSCILVAHSIWHRNDSLIKSRRTSGVVDLDTRSSPTSSDTSSALPLDPIQMFRKVGSLMMIDPGQGHTGNVFSAQHPEWLNLNNVLQSQFFMLPHARRAGIQTIVSVPMIYKMTAIAVLSWYSDELIPEDHIELQRIQRLLRSVTILSTLRQELLSVASLINAFDLVARFPFCLSLDNAITANGDLLDKNIEREDLHVCDVLPLALKWQLFDLVDKLAASMSSEDHAAVITLLKSLVNLSRNGLFDDVLAGNSHQLQNGDSNIEIDGKIRSKSALLLHLRYYLLYLHSVSPTEGNIFMEVNILLPVLNQVLDRSNEPVGSPSSNASDNSINSPAPTPPKPADNVECVLCKFNVPGHMHPGKPPVPIPSTSAPTIHRQLTFSATSKLSNSDRFFGEEGNPPSPVLREVNQLQKKLEAEYDKFSRKSALLDVAREGVRYEKGFSSSEIYEAIGAAHDSKAPSSKGKSASTEGTSSRQQLLDVLTSISEDTSCMVSYDQLLEIHKCLLAGSPDAGAIRTSAAVGYASPRIYRVFIPAGEISQAMELLISHLNDESRWQGRPLLCAYYAFAVLVFFIHPFYDANGRCARLLGNVIAKKLGFPMLFRASDKTIQLTEFLHKAVVTIEMLQNSKRQARQSRFLQGGRRENSSMWF